jgi:MarR family transcriptional regulator for hemolysin
MSDLELRLGYLIHDVSRLRRTLMDKWLSPLGITRSQWWVLAFLSRNDGMPQSELAMELDVGKVALGALIDRLEQGGFVRRELDPADKRVRRVVLTNQSKELVETLREVSSRFNRSVLDGMPRKDLEITAETLRRMKHKLIDRAKELSSEGAPPNRGKSAAGAVARSGSAQARSRSD